MTSSAELTDGFANAVWRLTLEDGREVVLKLSPPPELEQLRYERNLLRTEAMVYDLAGPAGVPIPGSCCTRGSTTRCWAATTWSCPPSAGSRGTRSGRPRRTSARSAGSWAVTWPG